MSTPLDEFAERAKKIAAESGEAVKEKLGALGSVEDWEQLKQVAGDLGEDAAAFVRKYPLQSVLGAAVVGFLLGSNLGRRK